MLEGDNANPPQNLRDRVGTVLRGKWTLDRQMGRGRVSTFYAATYRTGQRVALELLEPEWSVDPILSSGFLRESYVANRVQHPGVVRVLDDGVTEDGALFVVTDLLEGETLDALVARRGKLPRAEAYDLGDRLLDVIAAGHEVGVVHGDLSTLNVFLTTKGELRVLGYGVARFFAARFPEWSAGAWTTPEGRALPSAELDVRSDLWCIGGCLYKMFTGRFEPLANGQVRALREIALDASIETGEVIDRALLRGPAERWQVARLMQQAWRVAWAENDDAANTKEHTAIDAALQVDTASDVMQRGKQDSEPTSMTSPSIANPAADDPLGQTLSSQMNFRPPSMAAILAEEAARQEVDRQEAQRAQLAQLGFAAHPSGHHPSPSSHASRGPAPTLTATMTAPQGYPSPGPTPMHAPLAPPTPLQHSPRPGSLSDTDLAPQSLRPRAPSVPELTPPPTSVPQISQHGPSQSPPRSMGMYTPPPVTVTQLPSRILLLLVVAAFVLLCAGAVLAVIAMRILHRVPGMDP